jgi:hypothetical protein
MEGVRSLDQRWQEARRAWPTVAIPEEVFVRYVEERGGTDGTLADLYIACGCALGDPAALSAFESHYGREIRIALQRMKQPDSTVQEVEQQIREKLFVGEDGTRPRIADYTGRGDLRSWLRVIAVRTAVCCEKRIDRSSFMMTTCPTSPLPWIPSSSTCVSCTRPSSGPRSNMQSRPSLLGNETC